MGNLNQTKGFQAQEGVMTCNCESTTISSVNKHTTDTSEVHMGLGRHRLLLLLDVLEFPCNIPTPKAAMPTGHMEQCNKAVQTSSTCFKTDKISGLGNPSQIKKGVTKRIAMAPAA